MGSTKSKQSTLPSAIQHQITSFTDRLSRALVANNQSKKTFVTLADIWINSRANLLDTLYQISEQIDMYKLKVNLAGSSTSIAGGTAAVGGIILSPFSGGLSLILSAGGIVGSIAGTATTLGASIAEVYLTKELTETASKALETDAFYTKALGAAFKEVIVHEQELIKVLAELKSDSLLDDLALALKHSSCPEETKNRYSNLKFGSNSFEDILALVKNLYPDDWEFSKEIEEMNGLFKRAPTMADSLTSSNEFFQALKELSTLGPETLKSISSATLQGTAVSNAQAASLATQALSVSLGAVFVALDIYQFMQTSKNYQNGSRTELGEKIRIVSDRLNKERTKVEVLRDKFREQVDLDGY